MRSLLTLWLLGTMVFAGAVRASASPFAYTSNQYTNDVTVIDTAMNTVVATVPVGTYPQGVAVTPDGTAVYVTNDNDFTVSVIAAATNTVVATVPVGAYPVGVVATPDGTSVYVANFADNTLSVIATQTNTV